MRYLSLELVVRVLLSIVVLMALACTPTPTPTPTATATPAGPTYSEEEAIAVVKEHLMESEFCEMKVLAESGSKEWSARYNPSTLRWDVSLILRRSLKSVDQGTGQNTLFTWSVYERSKTVGATGYDPLNQMC